MIFLRVRAARAIEPYVRALTLGKNTQIVCYYLYVSYVTQIFHYTSCGGGGVDYHRISVFYKLRGSAGKLVLYSRMLSVPKSYRNYPILIF